MWNLAYQTSTNSERPNNSNPQTTNLIPVFKFHPSEATGILRCPSLDEHRTHTNRMNRLYFYGTTYIRLPTPYAELWMIMAMVENLVWAEIGELLAALAWKKRFGYFWSVWVRQWPNPNPLVSRGIHYGMPRVGNLPLTGTLRYTSSAQTLIVAF